MDQVNHPAHYGGEDNPYEAIKVIEAWGVGFHLGSVLKYIARAGKKVSGSEIEDLRKARWYLDRYIERHSPMPTDQLPGNSKSFPKLRQFLEQQDL